MRSDEHQQQLEEHERYLREQLKLMPEDMRESFAVYYELMAKLSYHKRMADNLEFDIKLLNLGRTPEDWGDNVSEEKGNSFP